MRAVRFVGLADTPRSPMLPGRNPDRSWYRAAARACAIQVGPFIFLDEMGPEICRAGRGLDVAPHPHLGLATVTYLFEVEFCTVARRNDGESA